MFCAILFSALQVIAAPVPIKPQTKIVLDKSRPHRVVFGDKLQPNIRRFNFEIQRERRLNFHVGDAGIELRLYTARKRQRIMPTATQFGEGIILSHRFKPGKYVLDVIRDHRHKRDYCWLNVDLSRRKD